MESKNVNYIHIPGKKNDFLDASKRVLNEFKHYGLNASSFSELKRYGFKQK